MRRRTAAPAPGSQGRTRRCPCGRNFEQKPAPSPVAPRRTKDKINPRPEGSPLQSTPAAPPLHRGGNGGWRIRQRKEGGGGGREGAGGGVLGLRPAARRVGFTEAGCVQKRHHLPTPPRNCMAQHGPSSVRSSAYLFW